MKQKHMTKEMRERIDKVIREGETLKEIAKSIDKDPTTISKEIKLHRQNATAHAMFQPQTLCRQCKMFNNCKLTSLYKSKSGSI